MENKSIIKVLKHFIFPLKQRNVLIYYPTLHPTIENFKLLCGKVKMLNIHRLAVVSVFNCTRGPT